MSFKGARNGLMKMALTTAKIAAGVAGGYLLGRTKNLKLALTLAGMLAGKKLAADPKGIADQIAHSNPQLQHLRGQLTSGLTGAAKELALATAAARIESMTQSIQKAEQGTQDLVGIVGSTDQEDADQDEASQDEASQDEASQDEASQDEASQDEASQEESAEDEQPEGETRDEAPARKRPSGKSTGKRPAKKSPAKKSARKSTSRSTAGSGAGR